MWIYFTGLTKAYFYCMKIMKLLTGQINLVIPNDIKYKENFQVLY